MVKKKNFNYFLFGLIVLIIIIIIGGIYYFKFQFLQKPKIIERERGELLPVFKVRPINFNSYTISYKNKTFLLYDMKFNSSNEAKEFLKEFKDYGAKGSIENFTLEKAEFKNFEAYNIIDFNRPVKAMFLIQNQTVIIVSGPTNINDLKEIVNWYLEKER